MDDYNRGKRLYVIYITFVINITNKIDYKH